MTDESPHPPAPSPQEQARLAFETAVSEVTASVGDLMLQDLETKPLTTGEKYALCRSIGEECIQEQELFALLDKKPEVVGTWLLLLFFAVVVAVVHCCSLLLLLFYVLRVGRVLMLSAAC